MITLPVTAEDRALAIELAEEIPSNIKNSITKGSKRALGCLGQIKVAQYYGVDFKVSTRDNDLYINDYKVEVKSKDRNVRSRLDYDATVAAYNTFQRTDFYFFTSCRKPNRYATFNEIFECDLMGYITKTRFYELAERVRGGTTDPNASAQQLASGTGTYHCDNYKLVYAALTPCTEDRHIYMPEDLPKPKKKVLVPDEEEIVWPGR